MLLVCIKCSKILQLEEVSFLTNLNVNLWLIALIEPSDLSMYNEMISSKGIDPNLLNLVQTLQCHKYMFIKIFSKKKQCVGWKLMILRPQNRWNVSHKNRETQWNALRCSKGVPKFLQDKHNNSDEWEVQVYFALFYNICFHHKSKLYEFDCIYRGSILLWKTRRCWRIFQSSTIACNLCCTECLIIIILIDVWQTLIFTRKYE